jgi:hypothetical protein
LTSFYDKLMPAPKGGGFAMKGYWVWCGSVIQGDDGKYHMFASRWPKNISFAPHWLTNSEIVRAVSDTPEGPYEFAEVVLPVRGEGYWDGKMTHNPTIHRCGDKFLLYYTGTTYEGNIPTADDPVQPGSERQVQAHANQRVGLAVASSVAGPWERMDQSILPPRTGKWDALMTTNPAPCVHPDGSVLLIYKAVGFRGDLLRVGVAKADHYLGLYERLADEPIFRFDETEDHVEDAYVWHSDSDGSGGGYQLIMKDMKGGICGERGGGIHARSADGVHWSISDPALAYSRTIHWNDGSTTLQSRLERPQLLIENGVPTHLFAATSIDGDRKAIDTWNMVIPIRKGISG